MSNSFFHKSKRISAATLVFLLGSLFIVVSHRANSENVTEETTPVVNRSEVLYELDEADPVAVAPDSSSQKGTKQEPESAVTVPTDFGRPHSLPLPSSLSVPQFEEKLFEFLNTRQYIAPLKWLKDKKVRDTGPYINGQYYGTHPAVRVYYSPGIIRWLTNGRIGEIPDGEMIVKEQYPYPAIRHEGKSEQELQDSLEAWTIMIKDSAGSHDGWFWSNPAKDQCVVDNHEFPFDHPLSGFGHYCIRCHASARSPDVESPQDNEFTFSSLRNIEGFPGEPMVFRVDDSWRLEADKEQASKKDANENEEKLAQSAVRDNHEFLPSSHPRCTQTSPPERLPLVSNSKFLEYYSSIETQSKSDVLHLPPVTHDWVVKQSDENHGLVISNQCMNCHAGLVAPFGPSMFIALEEGKHEYGDKGWHISPYGEWRWTPMGLSGRDPVFYAQLESELETLKREFEPEVAEQISENLVETCLRCHGAMGKHQFDLDKSKGHGDLKPEDKFTLDHVHATAETDEHIGRGQSKYGALARDGISCMICHRSQPRPQPAEDDRPYLQHFLDHSITGNVFLGPPNEVYGPFKDDEISTYVMEHATAMKPKHNEYISSSRMCGSCHTVNLPAVDRPLDQLPPEERELDLVQGEKVPLFKQFKHHVEQSTYLEWLNSEFENEFNTANPNAKSCQDCHMSKGLTVEKHGLEIETLSSRIASVQDSSYPDAENLAKHDDLNIRIRKEGYRRHNFSGLNAFLIEIVNHYDDVLGVRKHDFMTGSKIDVDNAIENFNQMARHETATIAIDAKREGQLLTATVDIQNLAGHRFPSGVGFRRAFLEMLVIENEGQPNEKVVWASGRTDKLGVILGANNQPLPTESFERDENNTQQYQPHHEVITSQNQVQIYETLLWDVKGNFSTSFIHGCDVTKDNRFLPKGWKHEGPAPDALTGNFLHATHPGKQAAKDPMYQNGSGGDSIQYQIELDKNVDASKLTVRASLYYQAMPPYFLKNLFDNAPNGEYTKRLHFMLSNMDLEGTAIENWKLFINSAEQIMK